MMVLIVLRGWGSRGHRDRSLLGLQHSKVDLEASLPYPIFHYEIISLSPFSNLGSISYSNLA